MKADKLKGKEGKEEWLAFLDFEEASRSEMKYVQHSS